MSNLTAKEVFGFTDVEEDHPFCWDMHDGDKCCVEEGSSNKNNLPKCQGTDRFKNPVAFSLELFAKFVLIMFTAAFCLRIYKTLF